MLTLNPSRAGNIDGNIKGTTECTNIAPRSIVIISHHIKYDIVEVEVISTTKILNHIAL